MGTLGRNGDLTATLTHIVNTVCVMYRGFLPVPRLVLGRYM
ncbi:Uncharacterized protein APZ42_002557 [Daphnia magna]|uniref:Uncharacterized protein n=1 Tax=Daphnia magna TaxID=35525 RepID=A0A164I6Z3_9CRUS|nr:Uncharacterized protein APZ42_002557 [Daphnia magna]